MKEVSQTSAWASQLLHGLANFCIPRPSALPCRGGSLMNETPNFDHDFFPSFSTLKGGENDFNKKNKDLFFDNMLNKKSLFEK